MLSGYTLCQRGLYQPMTKRMAETFSRNFFNLLTVQEYLCIHAERLIYTCIYYIGAMENVLIHTHNNTSQ